jgi:hypothetical protein
VFGAALDADGKRLYDVVTCSIGPASGSRTRSNAAVKSSYDIELLA